MFGSLDLYRDLNYLKSHQIGSITIQKNKHQFIIFACILSDATDDLLFNPSIQKAENIYRYIHQKDGVIDDSIYKKDNRLIAFSTCTSPSSKQRTMVFGILL